MNRVDEMVAKIEAAERQPAGAAAGSDDKLAKQLPVDKNCSAGVDHKKYRHRAGLHRNCDLVGGAQRREGMSSFREACR
jgi:hypothetical protein